MRGRGGWPRTFFLTPEGEPFYGGTYYPPEPRHGMPSFRQVLEAIAEAWRERRADVARQAAARAGRLARRGPRAGGVPARPALARGRAAAPHLAAGRGEGNGVPGRLRRRRERPLRAARRLGRAALAGGVAPARAPRSRSV